MTIYAPEGEGRASSEASQSLCDPLHPARNSAGTGFSHRFSGDRLDGNRQSESARGRYDLGDDYPHAP